MKKQLSTKITLLVKCIQQLNKQHTDIVKIHRYTKTLIFLALSIVLLSCNNTNKTDMEYQAKLNEAKKYYPFDKWREAFNDGLVQYTKENCNRAKQIFDNLILDLINIGENASEEDKIALFKKAILATNEHDTACEHRLIETGEREQLCELTDQITIACGLDPSKYGNNEGLASEWREW